MSVSYSTIDTVKTATFTGTGTLTGATALLTDPNDSSVATKAIIVGYTIIGKNMVIGSRYQKSLLMTPVTYGSKYVQLSLVYRKTLNKKQWDFIIFCVSFSIILFTVIGLTTPITGAIVRYKIPAIPFLFIAVFMFMNSKKLPIIFTENKFSQWVNTFL